MLPGTDAIDERVSRGSHHLLDDSATLSVDDINTNNNYFPSSASSTASALNEDAGDISICSMTSQTSEDSAVYTAPPPAASAPPPPPPPPRREHRHHHQDQDHEAHNTSSSSTNSNHNKHKICTEDDFERGDVLGQGASGTVYAAVHRPSNTRVALKEIPRWRIRSRAQEEALKTEINVHRRLRHRNVVRLYSYFVTSTTVVLVMERCSGGTLLQLLKKTGGAGAGAGAGGGAAGTAVPSAGLPEAVVSRAVRHVAAGLAYLHENNVIHRDLSLNNVLLDRHGVSKLIDFGMSRILCSSSSSSSSIPTSIPDSCASTSSSFLTVGGTLDYVAPEYLNRQHPQQHHAAGDVWSLGVLALELLTGSPPFFDPSESVTMQRIMHAHPHGLPMAAATAAHSSSSSTSASSASPRTSTSSFSREDNSSALSPTLQGCGHRQRLSVIGTNENNNQTKARLSTTGTSSMALRCSTDGHCYDFVSASLSSEAVALLTRMLMKNPALRPRIEEVMASPWLHHHATK